MEKATPLQIRQALELVEQLKRAGVRFVPIPAFDDDDWVYLIAKLNRRLDRLERIVNKGCYTSSGIKFS